MMDATRTRPSQLDDVLVGAGLMAGAANVIMQLGHPSVGHGVVESTVESGQLHRHPIKRSRTTFTYLAVAALGTDEEKRQYRRAVNGAHAQVRSTESSPVRYNAMDPELQLWVAACLYKGFEDSYEMLVGSLDHEALEEVYGAAATLGTTLQVPQEMWPADRAAFEEYWNRALEEISIDETVREHLYEIATLQFLPRFVSVPFGPFNRFVTTGFLPSQFREEMRLSWTPRQQRQFDLLMAATATVVKRLPKVLREFPFNLCMWDLRRRIRTGRPLV